MANKTVISLDWDTGGNIRHTIAGYIQPPPKNDPLLWVLAPSMPLFFAHQLGSLLPSHGLIACSLIMDMIFENKYILMPINRSLTGGTFEIIYTNSPQVKFLFKPRHKIIANNDSVEEGVRQLLNNYTHYIYSKLDGNMKIVLRTMASLILFTYFEYIEQLLNARVIGKGNDRWSKDYIQMSLFLRSLISEKYFVPSVDAEKENKEWAAKQTEHLKNKYTEIKSLRNSLFTQMGLR